MKITKYILSFTFLLVVLCAEAQQLRKEAFDLLNLDYPGLERVKAACDRQQWDEAAKALLDYYRQRTGIGHPDIDMQNIKISKEEQKKRLESRLQDPDKLWKFCMDDLDDRNRWDEFQTAYQDLIEKTSTPEAPWYIIPADRKWYRNLVVARLMVEKLRHLQLSLPTPNFDPASIIIPD